MFFTLEGFQTWIALHYLGTRMRANAKKYFTLDTKCWRLSD